MFSFGCPRYVQYRACPILNMFNLGHARYWTCLISGMPEIEHVQSRSCPRLNMFSFEYLMCNLGAGATYVQFRAAEAEHVQSRARPMLYVLFTVQFRHWKGTCAISGSRSWTCVISGMPDCILRAGHVPILGPTCHTEKEKRKLDKLWLPDQILIINLLMLGFSNILITKMLQNTDISITTEN